MKKYLTAFVLVVLVAAALYAAFLLGRHLRTGNAPGERPGDLTVLPQIREVDLYFADLNGQRLSIERREITGENREDLFARVVEELLRGPTDGNRLRTLPETTQIRTVYFRDGTVWVDFDAAVRDEHPGGTWTEVLAVYSIVNTMVENFSEVDWVQILIEGGQSDTLAGHVDISGPLTSRVQLLSGEWE